MPQDTCVIIPAAGQGKRMAADRNKLLLALGTQTILQHTLDLFLNHPRIHKIYLVIAEQDQKSIEAFTAPYKKIVLTHGGAERQDSVFNALEVIQQQSIRPKWVLVHDGARPLCPPSLITNILDQCAGHKATIPIIALTDTIRQITPKQMTVVDRSTLFATQTPQGFELDLLVQAYRQCKAKGWQVTDDASIVEKYGHSVATVEGSPQNLKITSPADLSLAEWWLAQ